MLFALATPSLTFALTITAERMRSVVRDMIGQIAEKPSFRMFSLGRLEKPVTKRGALAGPALGIASATQAARASERL
ncbi:MAG: hypothetical protein RJB13_400, partial [Pseudomonadota bacterium]